MLTDNRAKAQQIEILRFRLDSNQEDFEARERNLLERLAFLELPRFMADDEGVNEAPQQDAAPQLPRAEDPFRGLDSLIRPSVFNGYSSEDAQGHLDKFNLWTELREIQEDDIRKRQAFALLLRENALAWYKTLREDTINNWDALVHAFRERFTAPEMKMTQNRDLMERKQAPSESVDEYMKQMQKLANSVGKPETDIVYTIIQGFKPAIRDKLLMSDITSYNQLERLARAAERCVGSHTSDSSTDALAKTLMAADKSKNDAFTSVMKEMVNVLRDSYSKPVNAATALQGDNSALQTQAPPIVQSRTTTGRARFQGNCFYCKKPGHRAADCRMRKADEMRNSVQKPTLNQSSSA